MTQNKAFPHTGFKELTKNDRIWVQVGHSGSRSDQMTNSKHP